MTVTSTKPTDGRTDLITVLAGTWLMIGLFLDGYAHSNIIEELESFFTPWHAVFYSGFVATALWVVWVIAQRRKDTSDLKEAIPPGYGLAVVGIVVFAIGGIGDAIWHTVLGIEEGVDALLSPTHLLLFLGIVLIMTTPVRAVYRRSTTPTLEGVDRYAVILSTMLTTAILAFFFAYIWAPARPWPAEQIYDGATGEGEIFVAVGIGSILVSNLILLGPLAAILGRWRPPFGVATFAWTLVNVMIAAAFDFEILLALVVGAAGGLTADVVIRATGAGPSNRRGTMLAMSLSPLVAWSVYFLAIGLSGELRWPPEIWGGAILFTALSGLGLITVSRPAAPFRDERAPATSVAR